MPKRQNVSRARALRPSMTEAEAKLWRILRDRRLARWKFVRQFPIGPFIADFVCRQAKLVIEVDGSQHAESATDPERDAFLQSFGYGVLRFWNDDVLFRAEFVLEAVLAALEQAASPHPPRALSSARHPLPSGERVSGG